MSEPKIAQRGPYILDAESKKYAWCACGLSDNKPFCDGFHKVTDIRPVIVDIRESLVRVRVQREKNVRRWHPP